MGKRSSSSRPRATAELSAQDVERVIRQSEARLTVALELVAAPGECDLAGAIQTFQGAAGGDSEGPAVDGGVVRVPLLECGVRDWKHLVVLQRLVARQQRPVASVQPVSTGATAVNEAKAEELLGAEARVQHDARQRGVAHLALLFARESENRLWRFVNDFRLQAQSAGITSRSLLPAMQRVLIRLTADVVSPRSGSRTKQQQFDQAALHWSGKLGWRALVVSTVEQDAKPSVATQRTLLSMPRTPSALRFPTLKPLVESWMKENRDPRLPIVVILRGIPGSGKSTIGRELRAVCGELQVDCSICSADFFFETPRGYAFDVKGLGKAHDACKDSFTRAILASLQRADSAASTSRVVVLDNTNTQRWEYEPYQDIAAKYGCLVRVLEMTCSDAGTAFRMGQRNSHGVAPSKVVSMFLRWEHDADAQGFTPQFDGAPLTPNPVTDNDLGGKPVYVGLFFDQSTRAKLLEAVPPTHQNVVADHVTVLYKPDELFMRTVEVGNVVKLRCVEIVQDARGQAIRVELLENPSGIGIRNKVPHITISTAAGVSSSYSNELLEASSVSREPISPALILPATLGFAMIVQNQRVITTRSPFSFSDNSGCVASSLGRGDRAADAEVPITSLYVVCLDKTDHVAGASGTSTTSAERSSGIRDGSLLFDKLAYHLTGDCGAHRVLMLSSSALDTKASTTELLRYVNLHLEASGCNGVIFDEVVWSSGPSVSEELCKLLKRDSFQGVKELVVLTSSSPLEIALQPAIDRSVRASVIGIRAPSSSANAIKLKQLEDGDLHPFKVGPALDLLGMREQEHTRHQVLRACQKLTEASNVVFGQNTVSARRMDSTVLGLPADCIELGLALKQQAWPSLTELTRLLGSLAAELLKAGVHCVVSSDPRRFYISLCSSYHRSPLFRVRLIVLVDAADDAETQGVSEVTLHNDLRALSRDVCPDRAMYGALIALVCVTLRPAGHLDGARVASFVNLSCEQLVCAYLQSAGCTLDPRDIKSGKILLELLRVVRFAAEWSEAEWVEHLAPVSRAFANQNVNVGTRELKQTSDDRARALDGIDAASPNAVSELLEILAVRLARDPNIDVGSKANDEVSSVRAYATIHDRGAPGTAALHAVALSDELRDLANMESVNPSGERFECSSSCVSTRIDIVAGSRELLHRARDAFGRATVEGGSSPLEARALVVYEAESDREL